MAMREELKRTLKYRALAPLNGLVSEARSRFGRATTVRILLASDDREYTSEQQFAPLHAHREALAATGVVFVHLLVDDVLRLPRRFVRAYDVVGLKLSYREDERRVLEVARALRRRLVPEAKLIYFDGDDDLGIQWPRLLDEVDLYVKKHAFADLHEYTKPWIGKNNLTDYLARAHGFSFADDATPSSGGIAPDRLRKVALGWNIALDDRIVSLFAQERRRPRGGPRDVDVVCRATVTPGTWVEPYRRPVIECLRELANELVVLTPEHRVSQDLYYEELRRSRICVSPFGYGEICWRDFEAIACGCLLVKPDVGHLRTEPDLFVPHETYVPVRWDFADLDAVVRHHLAHPEEGERIRQNASARLAAYYDERRVIAAFEALLRTVGARPRTTLHVPS